MLNLAIFFALIYNLISLSIADDKKPDFQALFDNLKYQTLQVISSNQNLTEDEIAEGRKRGIFKEVDLQYFKECGEKCLSKLEELKIIPSVDQKFKAEYLYEDFELTKPVALRGVC